MLKPCRLVYFTCKTHILMPFFVIYDLKTSDLIERVLLIVQLENPSAPRSVCPARLLTALSVIHSGWPT